MLNRYLNRGLSEDFIKKKVLERVESNDKISRKAVKISIFFHFLYCLFILIGGAVVYSSVDTSARLVVLALFLGLLGAQLSSIVEIRDRWRYGKVCVDILRESSSDKSY